MPIRLLLEDERYYFGPDEIRYGSAKRRSRRYLSRGAILNKYASPDRRFIKIAIMQPAREWSPPPGLQLTQAK
jgi:hypothetical protein